VSISVRTWPNFSLIFTTSYSPAAIQRLGDTGSECTVSGAVCPERPFSVLRMGLSEKERVVCRCIKPADCLLGRTPPISLYIFMLK